MVAMSIWATYGLDEEEEIPTEEEIEKQLELMDNHFNRIATTDPENREYYVKSQHCIRPRCRKFKCYLCGDWYVFEGSRDRNEYELCCFCMDIQIHFNSAFMERLNRLRELMGWDHNDDD